MSTWNLRPLPTNSMRAGEACAITARQLLMARDLLSGDLMDGFAELKPNDISNILQELKEAGKIVFEGVKKGGKWVFLKLKWQQTQK